MSWATALAAFVMVLALGALLEVRMRQLVADGVAVAAALAAAVVVLTDDWITLGVFLACFAASQVLSWAAAHWKSVRSAPEQRSI